MKIIITGTTGMVGEGILLECLNNNQITQVLSISRKSCEVQNTKLKELIVPDFTKLDDYIDELFPYDACFFCAGISSVGMNEEKFKYITYDTTLFFANTLVRTNPNMVFIYVSGKGTDSSEKGKVMWARIKGKTENDLSKLAFAKQYNFRPAAMLPYHNQKHVKKLYVIIAKILYLLAPSSVISLSDVGKAMINAVKQNNLKNVLEIKDIKQLVG